MSDFARSVQILIELVGNPEQRLTEINRLTDQLNHKKIGLNDAVSGLAGGANNAAGALGKVASTTQDVAKNASDLSGKSVSAFGKIKESVLDLNSGVQTLAASLAGIAAGGAISGLAWKASADFKLINEQIDDALAANKKLGITKEEMDAFVKEQAESGEGTRQDTKSEIYSVLMASQKYLKGDSLAKLNQADAITDFWFARQEIMKQQGISSPEQLIRMTTRSEGKMIGTQLARFQTATGASEKDVGSAKSRMKFLTGQETDMQVEMAKRPWEAMLVAVTQLKYAIGDGLAPTMSVFIKLLTGAVKLLNSIPGAAPLIGLAGAAIAFVSTLTLLNGVLTPGIALLKQMVLWTQMHSAAQLKDLVVSKARIVTDWLGITSLGARTVATTGLTTATIGLAAAEWAALSPLLLLAVPLIAVAGLLYLAETRTHVFSKALDRLSKTEMSKDLIQWLEDVGYWAGYAVDKLGSVMGAGIETGIINPIVGPIEGLDNLYKNFKSGGIPNVLGLGGGDSSENNSILLTTKLFQPISAISGHISTIDEVTSWIKGLLGTGWDAINGIYSGIINFPKNAYKFVVDGLTNFGKWIYNGIVYWATWIYNGILYWAGEVRKAYDHIIDSLGLREFSDNFNAYVLELGDKFTTLVDDVKTSISNLIDNFSTLVDDIKTTITDLVDKFTTFVSDIKTSISNLIPGWMKGSDSGNAASGSEEGFIEFIRNAKKGSENYDKYAQLSDEALRAAYREGLTGTPQDRPNMTDPYEYDNIVKYAVPEYAKSGASSSTASLFSNIPTGNLSPHETEVKRSEGNIDYEASKQRGIDAGLILGEGFAKGGFVQKTGFALVHSGEPIIPAEVASSSRLQTILENIAYGSETTTTSTITNNPIIHIHYEADPRRGILLDETAFEHKVSDIIAKRLRQLNGY